MESLDFAIFTEIIARIPGNTIRSCRPWAMPKSIGDLTEMAYSCKGTLDYPT